MRRTRDTSEVRHPLFARFYARMSEGAEDKGAAEHRRKLLADLTGRVVEVGAGNGLNFGHYPASVDEVVAVEPEPLLRQLAQEAAARAPVRVRVVDGTADALPLDDASVDAAVCSLVLCSVPDQARALAEVRRVLRPDGELRFYEHVIARDRRYARFQRVVDVVHPHVSGGCHVTRDTLSAIGKAGFEVTDLSRFRFAPALFAVGSAPRILGRARVRAA